MNTFLKSMKNKAGDAGKKTRKVIADESLEIIRSAKSQVGGEKMQGVGNTSEKDTSNTKETDESPKAQISPEKQARMIEALEAEMKDIKEKREYFVQPGKYPGSQSVSAWRHNR